MPKPVEMMIMSGCPYCQKAFQLIEELKDEHSEYKTVPLQIIDEKNQPELAASYDYYYVPTFFVDKQKVLEGAPTKESVEKVFKTALS